MANLYMMSGQWPFTTALELLLDCWESPEIDFVSVKLFGLTPVPLSQTIVLLPEASKSGSPTIQDAQFVSQDFLCGKL